jgi:hypothetical protein
MTQTRRARTNATHSPGLAVLAFDLGAEIAQRLAVGGIAGQNFVGERQAVRGDDQCDDELRAIGPLVAAVSVASLAVLGKIGSVHLEIGAGQVVEQHVERGVEQIAPALGQMREQSLFVSEQQIMAGIEFVRFRKPEVGAEEIGHGAVEEPLAMQPPFAARRDEPVARQHLQHVIPTRALAASRQALGPEAIEPQLTP